MRETRNAQRTIFDIFTEHPLGDQFKALSQAMLVGGNNRLSQLKTCLEAAHHFQLSNEQARSFFSHMTEGVEQNWGSACQQAELTEVDKHLFWKRQFLNPFSLIEQVTKERCIKLPVCLIISYKT